MAKTKKQLLGEIMSEIGRKGGQAGTGKSKLRGDSEYYRRIAKKARKAVKR